MEYIAIVWNICVLLVIGLLSQTLALHQESQLLDDNLADYRLFLQKTNLDGQEQQQQRTGKAAPVCKSVGKTCASCISVSSCTGLGDGTYKQDIEYCIANNYCLNGACTNASNPFCDGSANIGFPCTDVGVFPDPFYCNKYHFCTPPSDTFIHVQATCETNYTYNAGNRACDTHISKAKNCNNGTNQVYPVPLCKKLLQNGTVAGSIYYKCLRVNGFLYPYMFNCPRGGKYNDKTQSCVQPSSAMPAPNTPSKPTSIFGRPNDPEFGAVDYTNGRQPTVIFHPPPTLINVFPSNGEFQYIHP